MRRLALAAATLWLAGGVAAATPSVTVSDPRPFGYFLGDVVRRDVLVRTGPGEKLDLGSRPRAGPVNYWLELSAADLTEGRNGDDRLYRLSLAYQTFYAPLDPRKLVIPGFKLKIDSGGESLELSVPEFAFLTSPLRQLFSEKGDTAGSATNLMPDHVALKRPTGAERTALLVAGLVCVAALAALAHHNAWWPFQRRPRRPFTQAARFFRARAAHLTGAGGYRTALLKLHRAFDLAAGRRVLADDVDGFLRQHPEFAPFRADVERMFASSREAFFANDVERASAAMPLAAVTRLGQQLAVAERSAA
ncbi:MAG: nonribosomal peptide synthetase MxaA [Hyphomicrobium sp.]|jgi:mxaA protein